MVLRATGTITVLRLGRVSKQDIAATQQVINYLLDIGLARTFGQDPEVLLQVHQKAEEVNTKLWQLKSLWVEVIFLKD